MDRRLGAPEQHILAVKGNLANNYDKIGRQDEALLLKRDVYSGFLKLHGAEHRETLVALAKCTLMCKICENRLVS